MKYRELEDNFDSIEDYYQHLIEIEEYEKEKYYRIKELQKIDSDYLSHPF